MNGTPHRMHKLLIGLLVVLFGLQAANRTSHAQTLRVFVLAGQSNMQGQAVVDLDHPQHYNSGKGTLVWAMQHSETQPRMTHLRQPDGGWTVRKDVVVRYRTEHELKRGGLSIGYSGYEGQHHFGPELQFGNVVGDYFGDPVLLIKTCWGGKSLYQDFRPPSADGETGSYYLRMMREVTEALEQLATDFPELKIDGYELSGFVWMQGWNDMIDADATAEYAQNLALLAGDVRKEFNAPQLPFVVGELGNGGEAKPNSNMERFRSAQKTGTDRIPFAKFVFTHPFARPADMSPNVSHLHHWYGNAESYFLVGDALGTAMVELLEQSGGRNAPNTTSPSPQ